LIEGLDVLRNGHVAISWNDSVHLFDHRFEHYRSFPAQGKIRALSDNSLLVVSTQAEVNDTSRCCGALGLTGFMDVGRQYNCEKSFVYGTAVNYKVAKHITTISRYNLEGEQLFKTSLEGQGHPKYNVVEQNGFLMVGLATKDTSRYIPLLDNNGNFQDTLFMNVRDGKLRLTKLSFDGAVIWQKTIKDVYMFDVLPEYQLLTDSENSLWWVSASEIFQFDFNGKLLASSNYPKDSCAESREHSLGIFKGLYLFTTSSPGHLNYSYTLNENQGVQDLPLSVGPHLIGEENEEFYFADRNSITAAGKGDRVIFSTQNSPYVLFDYPVKGCDGSFYFLASEDYQNYDLVRIQ
jgi:hypothetical protein